MIFWHLGGTIVAFRYVFRDPNIDLRFLALGSVLPDLIDKPIGTILLADSLQSGQIFGHSLLFSSLAMAAALALTRPGIWRKRLLALAIGSLFHLVLDGMWTIRETFLWPAFGWAFPPGPEAYWGGLLERVLSDPWRIVQELAGIGYLIYLARKAELGDAGPRRQFWKTGVIQT